MPEYRFDKYGLNQDESPAFINAFDTICMVIFTVEYFSRLICAHQTPQHVLDRSLPHELNTEDLQAWNSFIKQEQEKLDKNNYNLKG